MERECTQITMYGVYSNIGLALFKFIAGVVGNSMAMIADGVHSLSDLVTDAITLWAARLTHKPQDADHPYGQTERGRTEGERGGKRRGRGEKAAHVF
jgi:divalent metal cation (Fe/Co/Zn/Cd) transporter